jgi:hypothetical protein
MTCPACNESEVPAGKVLCRRCWGLVPMEMRKDVSAARRAYRGTHDSDLALLRWHEYEAAKDAAIRAAMAVLNPGVSA